MAAPKQKKKAIQPQNKSTRNSAGSRSSSGPRKLPATGKAQSAKTSARVANSGPRDSSSLTRHGLLGDEISLNRKLDIAGWVMAIVGILTLLSLFSSQRGWLTSGWLIAISRAFGWGMYVFPIGLLGIGVWLILRRFERIPQLALERAVGLVVFYMNLLVWLHFGACSAFRLDRTLIMPLAEKGQGGGYVGGVLLNILVASLGWGGTVVVLLAWLVIAIAFTLDKPVLNLFSWITKPVDRLLIMWREKAAQNAALKTISAQNSTFVPFDRNLPLQQVKDVSSVDEEPFPPESVRAVPQWVLPPVDEILEVGGEVSYDDEIDRQRALTIEETLASFGAPAKVVEINRGPTITQFGVEPGFTESRSGPLRVRVGKIAALANDLALALSSKRIRIQAPVPSKGFVGIEVPNEEIALVALRDVIESDAFQRLKSPLRFALGQDVAGNPVAADLAAMPHLLIAGTTGSGKSVCVNAIICGLLLHNTPDDLRLIMVDPKRVELTNYNGIPHLLAPVVVEMERVVGALQWAGREMDARYHRLAQSGARNIVDYNARMAARGEHKLPYLVVVIDELADLMMLAPEDTERTITRLAQLARATGIHLIIATQRPSVDVLTGLIKANFPARIAFAVASGVDSRVILDQPGAETLLGRGDMLLQSPDAAAAVRLQGVFVSDTEIQRLVTYWRELAGSVDSPPISHPNGSPVDALPPGIPLKQMPMWDEMSPQEELDPLYDECVDLSRRQGRASISMFQRRLRIGYTRSARLIETMQEKGIIGKEASSQGFEILDYGPAAPPVEKD